jgi:hypothetical protein
METTLYAVFTVACFPVPAVVNKIGTRTSMFIGILGYGGTVLLLPLWFLYLNIFFLNNAHILHIYM